MENERTLEQYSPPENFSYKSFEALTRLARMMALHPLILNSGQAIFNRLSPERVVSMQEKNVVDWFKFAVGSTIAYRQFLDNCGVDYRNINTINDVRRFLHPTTKENYVHRFPLESRIARQSDGTPYLPEKFIHSAGTSPTVWLLEKGAQRTLALQMGPYLDGLWNINRVPTVYVSCYSPGMYGGGRVADAVMVLAGNPRYNLSIVTPGSNLQDALDIITEIQAMGIYKQIILGGYPPFIGKLIHSGVANGIKWPDLNVSLTLGGDGFPEEWRMSIYNALGIDVNEPGGAMRIVEGYGATDFGAGGGCSPLTVLVRQMALNNSEIRRALWGRSDIIPTVSHTNPNFVIHATDDGRLIANTLTLTPQPNYDIQDAGWVIPYREAIRIIGGSDNFKTAEAEVENQLLQWGFSLRSIMKSPLVCVLGRIHGKQIGTSFDGAVIHPQTIERVLLANDVPYNDFQVNLKTDPTGNDGLVLKLSIDIEVRQGLQPNSVSIGLDGLSSDILQELLDHNDDFVTSHKDNPEGATPVVRIHSYNTGPFEGNDSTIKTVKLNQR